MMLSSAATRDREDESLTLPTGDHKNEFQYHKFFPYVGRPFTSLHLRSILTVGGLILLVFPLVLNLSTGESLLYQSQNGQSSLTATATADVDGDVGKIEESSASATADSNGSAASGQCLNLDLNQDMDSLIASARQVFITMPAKAGGTSMQAFANKCVGKLKVKDGKDPNILNPGRFNKESLISNLHAPPIVASHLHNSDGLIRLSKYPSRETLMIHIHREETNRIVSAVKHVLDKVCATNPHKVRLNIIKNGTECILEEGPVVDAIASHTDEIGYGNDILNCKSYKALQENGPQLVVINYKQVDKLQALLAKHHCPHLELPVHANIAEEKSTNVFLKLQTGGVVNIKDWLREKGPSLEVALNLRQGASCQAKTFHMEDELFGCPDEALRVTTESIKGW